MGRLDDPDRGYFFSPDRHMLFLFVREERPDVGLRGATARRSRPSARHRQPAESFPDVEAGVTGGPAIATDEMATAFDDSGLATALASAITAGLLLLAFRRVVGAAC